MQGYVALHRKLMESWVSEDPMALALWVRMLLEATHKPRKKIYKGETYNLDKGQFLFGLNKWSEKTGIPREVIRKRIDMLVNDGMITRQKHPHISVITVVKWDSYQQDNTVKTQQEHPDNTATTRQQQQYNNVNNGDNGNNVNKGAVSEKPETPKKPPRKKFVKPEHDEVLNYFIERDVEPMLARQKTEEFFAYYDSVDWHVGRNKMKDWKGAVRTWVAKLNGNKAPAKRPGETLQQFKTRTEQLKAGGRQYLSDD